MAERLVSISQLLPRGRMQGGVAAPGACRPRRVGAVLLALACCTAWAMPRQASADTAPDVEITSKPMPGTGIPQWTVRAVIQAKPEQVWRIVDDCNGYHRTMPRVTWSRELSRTANRVICRTKVHMPFPLSDLESESEGLNTISPGRWQREFRHLSGDFVKNDGTWTLTPAGPAGEQTTVVYVLHSIPTSHVPDSMVRSGQAAAMRELMKNVAARAAQP